MTTMKIGEGVSDSACVKMLTQPVIHLQPITLRDLFISRHALASAPSLNLSLHPHPPWNAQKSSVGEWYTDIHVYSIAN